MVNLKLVGSNVRKLSAFRNQNFSGKVSLSTNIKILSMEAVEKQKGALKVGYSFEVDYKDLGNIYLEGNLFVSSDDKTVKSILSSWDKKEFRGEENNVITNMILQKATIKCFALEEEFGLPPHIKLPTVNIPQKEE